MTDNTYGFKPEDYADIATNHPRLNKNRSSGKAPNLVLVNEESSSGEKSGDGLFVVNLTFSRHPNDSSQWTATGDKTGAEIASAFLSGKNVVLYGDFNGNGGSYYAHAFGAFTNIGVAIGTSEVPVKFYAGDDEYLYASTV